MYVVLRCGLKNQLHLYKTFNKQQSSNHSVNHHHHHCSINMTDYTCHAPHTQFECDRKVANNTITYTGRNSHEPSSRYASVIFRQVLSVSDPNSTASNHHVTKLLMTVHTSTVSWSECRPVHSWPCSQLHLLCWRQWSFLITLHWGVDDAKYTQLCVCLSVCPLPHSHTTVTRGNGRRCPIGRICNRCMGFIAMTTQRRMQNVSECLYSLYA